MHPRQIERFFRILSQEFDEPATIILTGAAAGSLLGRVRPSLDIDFAIQPNHPRAWEKLEGAIQRTIARSGIRANYAEDIDRWSAVSFLRYRDHTRPYRTFGTIRIRVLDPAYWSIGKITRYLEPDIRDLVAVLKRQRISATSLVRLWALAIRRSPRSPALTQCRRQTEHFLRTWGSRVWGATFDAEQAIRTFHRALTGSAHVPRKRP